MLAVVGSVLTLSIVTAESRASVPVSSECTSECSFRDTDGFGKLLEIIRQLFGFLGGVPDLIPEDPNAAMETVVACYLQAGPPQGLNPDEADAARAMVLDAYSALQEVACDLDPAAVAHFTAMLESLYSDLGGDPLDLH